MKGLPVEVGDYRRAYNVIRICVYCLPLKEVVATELLMTLQWDLP